MTARLYGMKKLHDGRQVDSGSEEWRCECLARTLMQLGGPEREEWLRGYGKPADQASMRLLIRSIATDRRRPVK